MNEKVLVVEDSVEIRLALQMALQEDGYVVRAEANGDDGLVAFHQFSPDIILLDMQMPGMSGIELCAAIRQSSEVPVIMFTAANQREKVVEAKAKGVNDFVLKGTGIEELLTRVESHLQRLRDSSQVEAAVSSTTEQSAKPEQLAPVALIVDPDTGFRADVNSVLTRLGCAVAESSTGADALRQMELAIPDLLLLELVLPDMDGFRLLKTLAMNHATRHMTVVVSTERSSPEAIRKASYYRVADFVTKPWSLDQMDTRLRSAVTKARRRMPGRAA